MILCDTHVLLWWVAGSSRLGEVPRARLEAAAARGELAVADITLWEVAMLAAKGRIQLPVPVADLLDDLILALGLRVLPITPRIAQAAQADDIVHGDPADRLIVATARSHGAALMTQDARLHALDNLPLVW